MSPRRTTKEPQLVAGSPLAPIVEQLRAMVRGLEETSLPDADGDAAAFVRGKVEGIESAILLVQRAGALHVVTEEGQRLVRLERHADDASLAARVARLEREVLARRSTTKALPEILKTPRATGGKCERAILQVLAQRQGRPTSLVQLAILTGYSVSSSSFNNAVGALRSRAAVSGGRHDLRATPAGLKDAGDVAPMPGEGTVALLDFWCAKLGKAEGVILRAAVHGSTLGFANAGELADATGYSPTSSAFANAIGRLRTLQLVERGWPLRASSSFRRRAS